jgi:hypothetical protein
MTRTRFFALGIATVLVGVGLAGCGRGAAPTAAEALASSDVVLASDVLAASDVVTAAEPSPSASADKSTRKHKAGPRALLRKNTLHAEAVVQTKDGVKTVVAQRGTVTAINDKSVTVKSTDGFTLTWSFGNPLKVVERRTTVQPNAVKAGATVGVAGTKDGTTTTARLISIRS